MLIPGIFGGICLVLAAIAFQILPFSWVGLMVMLLGLGAVGGGGLRDVLRPALHGGARLLPARRHDTLRPARSRRSAGVLLVGAGARRRGLAAGESELIGLVGRADTPIAPDGRVFVQGEYWNARADEAIPAESNVEVTAVEGMRLRVRRATADH